MSRARCFALLFFGAFVLGANQDTDIAGEAQRARQAMLDPVLENAWLVPYPQF